MRPSSGTSKSGDKELPLKWVELPPNRLQNLKLKQNLSDSLSVVLI
jgi:hypothetical protein